MQTALTSTATRFNLPPGPRIAPLQMYRYIRDPYGFYAHCANKYGDPFTVPALSVGSIVVTGHPEGIRDVFSADPTCFVPFAPHVLGPVLGDTSVLHTSGARHKRDRKLLTPPFHGARMRSYAEIIRNCTLSEVLEWAQSTDVSLHRSAQSISLEIIIRAVFGFTEDQHVTAFRRSIAELMDSMAPSILFFPQLRRPFFGLGPWSRFAGRRQTFDTFLFDEIGRRRSNGWRGEDIFSLLLDARYDDGESMSDEEIRNQLATLLVAGHETTGIALCWAIYWLLREPVMLEKVRSEIDALGPNPQADTLATLPFLDAICSETLRLYPIFPDTRRRLARPLAVRGHVLPPGTAISVAPMLVHQREELYPEPAAFRPERFLERKYGPFEYVPFGGGARRCLGAAFAMYEMKIVLGTLLGHFNLELVDTGPVVPARRNITMEPRGGVPVRLLGRRLLTPSQAAAASA